MSEDELTLVKNLLRRIKDKNRRLKDVEDDYEKMENYLSKRESVLSSISAKTYHYVYLLVDKRNDNIYVGMRSCETKPEEDIGYMGSGVMLDSDRSHYKKYIIANCVDRNIASIIETMIVNDEFVKRDDTINVTSNCASSRLVQQRNGIEKAKEMGKTFGRPIEIDRDELNSLFDEGVKPTEISKKLGISRASVYRLKKNN